jgi:hypothetical protein
MGLGVGSDGADGEPGVAMERGHGEAGRSCIAKRLRGGGRRTGLLRKRNVWLTVDREAVQLSPAALCFRKG